MRGLPWNTLIPRCGRFRCPVLIHCCGVLCGCGSACSRGPQAVQGPRGAPTAAGPSQRRCWRRPTRRSPPRGGGRPSLPCGLLVAGLGLLACRVAQPFAGCVAGPVRGAFGPGIAGTYIQGEPHGSKACGDEGSRLGLHCRHGGRRCAWRPACDAHPQPDHDDAGRPVPTSSCKGRPASPPRRRSPRSRCTPA
jgi:hypothetical protein